MPARIAIVSDAVYPYHAGGKETRIHRLAQGLAEAGNEVTIYTMKWWEGDDRIVRDGIALQAISPLYPLYIGGKRSIRQALLFGLASLKLIRYRFDVIEADQMPFFPIVGARLAAWWRRKPLVVTWHEVWGAKYWKQYLGYFGALAYVVERVSVRAADRIIAVSPLTAERLVKNLGYTGPIDVIANGIDVAALANTTTYDISVPACDLLYAGRLIAHKRVDVVLRAYAKLRAERPEVSLRIIGDGPEAGPLRSLAVDLGLEPATIFCGRLEAEADVYAAMRRAKVFMTASEREGFGIAVLEAMACGLPVVMGSHPDNAARLIIGSGGLVVPTTPEAFADAAALVLDGHPVSPLEAARPYDWSVAQVELVRLYEYLAGHRKEAYRAF